MCKIQKKFSFPNQRNKSGLKKLSGVHHEVKRRLFLGERNKDIARETGLTPVTVSNIKNSHLMQEQLAAMQGLTDAHFVELKRRITKKADECLDLIEAAISGEVEGERVPLAMRLKQANGLLDRAGFSMTTDNRGFGELTREDIDLIKKRAVEMKKTKNCVYEVPCESNPGPNASC